jgi:hypothetical protein
MVGLQVVVNDDNGNALPNIPVKVYVHSCNILGGTSNNYYIYGITDATGNAFFSNVQAYCQFTATANDPSSPEYQPNYSTGSGSSNDTLTSGAYISIVLSQIINSTNGKCPNGYTLMPNGKCEQLTGPNKLLNFSIFDILIIVVIIIVFILVFAKIRRNKK